MSDKCTLSQISSLTGDNYELDIVFMHGLNGHGTDTWKHSAASKPSSMIGWPFRRPTKTPTLPDSFWPEWIAADFPNATVWTLSYPAESTAWRGSAMPLPDRAINVLQLFHRKGIGARPVILVVHSLGGLLAKQMLQTAYTQNNPEWEKVGRAISGVLFLATPHAGSFLASVAKLFGMISRTNWTIEDLQHHEPHLRSLNQWFRNKFEDLQLKAHVLCEMKKTSGVFVVDQTSADPGIQAIRVIPVDKDHIDICKPQSRDDQVFVEAQGFISECISQHKFLDPQKTLPLVGTSKSKSPLDKVLDEFESSIAANGEEALMSAIARRFAKGETARLLRNASLPWNGMKFSTRVHVFLSTLEQLKHFLIDPTRDFKDISPQIKAIIERIEIELRTE